MEDTETQQMTIGTLAKAAGVGVETVRFYQRKGLLEIPSSNAGIRRYSNSHVRIIRFVKRVQELGFTLKDAKDFLDLGDCCSETQPHLAEVFRAKITEVQQKIADLNRMVEMLHQFSTTCGSETPRNHHCSLLDCFENNWECCDPQKRREP